MTGVFVIGSAVSVLLEQLFTDPYGSGQWAPAGYTQLQYNEGTAEAAEERIRRLEEQIALLEKGVH